MKLSDTKIITDEVSISTVDYEERDDGRIYFNLSPNVHNVRKDLNSDIEQALIKMLIPHKEQGNEN